MATFVAGALGGVRPEVMGVGPVASTKKVLAKTGLTDRRLSISSRQTRHSQHSP